MIQCNCIIFWPSMMILYTSCPRPKDDLYWFWGQKIKINLWVWSFSHFHRISQLSFCAFLMTKPFGWYHKYWRCGLWSLTYFWKTWTLPITFLYHFIFGMRVPFDKTFYSYHSFGTHDHVPSVLNMWSWPWPLTYISKLNHCTCRTLSHFVSFLVGLLQIYIFILKMTMLKVKIKMDITSTCKGCKVLTNYLIWKSQTHLFTAKQWILKLNRNTKCVNNK